MGIRMPTLNDFECAYQTNKVSQSLDLIWNATDFSKQNLVKVESKVD